MTDQPARGSAEQQPTEPVSAPWTVVWTRGEATAEIAGLLSDGNPVRVEGDLRDACIDARADALVTKKLTSFDLVSTVVPHRVDPDEIKGVAAAVGSGPNSGLAARVAHRIAANLDVGGMLVTAPSPGATRAAAHRLLAEVARSAPGFDRRLQVDGGAPSIVDGLATGTLLVIGEPGGSWIHRQFFGPGRKLIHAAPTGALVVRSAPLRCFQVAAEPSYLGAVMRAEDAAAVMTARVIPVVDDGRLIGIVRQSALRAADPDAPVVELMEPPVSLDRADPIDAAWALAAEFESAPIPVTAPDGTLWGTVDPRAVGIGDASPQ